MTDDVLSEQKAYYRARAPEYDEWWRRERSHDQGPEFKAQWDAEVDHVERALEDFSPIGRVLEFASGTGWWTQRLARHASSLTCVDASAETIAIARERVPSARFVQADIFDWEPDATYDVVFFSFWLSHVPAERFEPFWSLVGACLSAQGRVFFVDNRAPADTKARDGRSVRTLNDGREFTIVKIYYDAADVQDRLAGLGWNVDVRATPTHFIYGNGHRSGRAPRAGPTD